MSKIRVYRQHKINRERKMTWQVRQSQRPWNACSMRVDAESVL